MPSRKKFLLFSLLPLILLVFAAETACRIKFFLANNEVGYLLTPIITVGPNKEVEFIAPIVINSPKSDTLIFSPCKGRLLPKTFNSYRWPGPEPTDSENKKEIRIIAVGGSTVASIFNADVDSWVFRLEKLLNSVPELENKIEVINAGIPGSGIPQIHNRLLEKGFALKPDIVLYYEAINDLGSFDFWNTTDKALFLFNQSMAGKIFKSLHYRSMLYTYLIEKYAFNKMDDNKFSVHEFQIENSFGNIVKDCLSRDIDFIYVKQVCNFPQRIDNYDLTNLFNLRAYTDSLMYLFNNDILSEMQLRDYWYNYRCLQQRLIVSVEAELCKREGCNVIDPQDDFDNSGIAAEQLYISDMVHKTCVGDSLLAKSVFESLKPIVSAFLDKQLSVR